MAEEQKTPADKPAQAQPGQQQQQQPMQFKTEYGSLSTIYTNFCRVNVTPEELILDFGLNPQLAPTETAIQMTHRVVMNFYTAKRLLNALLGVVGQHEKAYGVLELDIQRRAQRAGGGATIQPPQRPSN